MPIENAILWLARLPTGSAVLVVVACGVAGSLGVMAAFHAVLPRTLRQSHNDVAGFVLAIVGVTYAVLLAFVAVAAWEGYGRAGALVQAEANAAGDIDRVAAGLPPPVAAEVRRAVSTYAETVVQLEWPALSGGEEAPASGWRSLEAIQRALAQGRADDPWVAAVKSEALRQLPSLYDARRNRLQSARAELPPILWWNLFAGAAVVIVFACLFGAPSVWMHAAMIALLATSIGLVLALVLLLYNPYVGRNHVSAASFNALLTELQMRSPGQ